MDYRRIYKMLIRYLYLYLFLLFTASCTGAQEYGYDLDHIVITEGTPDPTKNIEPFQESELTHDQTLDIVNWNVDWLGAPEMVDYEHGDRETHITQIAQKLLAMDADIYALQEVVVGGGKGNALIDLVAKLNELAGGYAYAGSWSEYHSYYWEDDDPEFPPQCLAYIWNRDVVTVNNDTALLYDKAGRYDFASGRLPYLLDARVNLNGNTQRYMIFNLHLKAFAQHDNRRKNSMTLLRHYLNEQYATNNVVLAGDLNVAAEPGALGEITDWGFYDDHEGDGLTDFVHAAGQKTDTGYHNIDHILVSNELFDELAYVPKSFRNITISGTREEGLSSHNAYMTRLYVHEETGEVDPHEVYMRASHYQMIVDYVNNQDLPNTHIYPEDNEDYFGASAYYSNFDIEADGSWNRDVFESWEEAVRSALSTVLLPALYPEASIDDEAYTIYFDTYNGNTESMDHFHFICTRTAPDPQFTNYDGPLNNLSRLKDDPIRVYPNPVRNNVLNIAGITRSTLFKVINLQGKTVLHGQLNTGKSVLSLNRIQPGCYLLLLESPAYGTIVKQIVK